jgi:ligand-binding sensor domain-containing protein
LIVVKAIDLKNRPNTFSLFCICFFLPGMLLAQQFGLRNYTAADGLAQSQVFAMIEDSRGYIWLGTRGGGLSRFDGKDFVNYTSREGLINNYLWTLHEDRQGDIWVGTNGGVCRFDGQVFHRYNLHDSVLCIAEDETGKIWLGTNSGLFCQQQDSAGKLSFESFRQLEGLTSQAVHAIHIDPSGWQWLGLESKVWAWKGDSVLRFGSREGIPYGKKIRDFFADTQGKLWAATYGGGLLQRVGGRFRAQAPRGALYRGYLFDIESDREGRLWMATQNSGVVIYDPQNDKLSSLQDSDGLPTN